jgi:hypothetical protein
MAALPLPCALWSLDRVKGRDGCPQPSAKRSTYQQLAADMSPTFRTASRPESSTWRQPGRQETRYLFGS